MKDLQGKKRCWLKRSMANPLGESQKKEMLFTMIDMKLVSRVLHMSLISSSQLNWCQEKLDNIEFKEGNVIRECTSPLFPSSWWVFQEKWNPILGVSFKIKRNNFIHFLRGFSCIHLFSLVWKFINTFLILNDGRSEWKW